MRHNFSSFLRTVIAAACGWVTGRMMELFLPVEVLIGIAAVTIPALVVMIILNIIGTSRYNRLAKKLIEKVETGQVKIG